MEIIATRNASLAADLREALKQHTLKDSPSSKDAPLSEAVAAADADEDADDADDDDMDDETDEEKGVCLQKPPHQSLKPSSKDVSHASLLDLLHRGNCKGKVLKY